ncbi:MAG: hypothetical protein HYX51_02795 [Chloroflexi bacterium]|nr:hypothetical protein [Chloroflexota bacterium]
MGLIDGQVNIAFKKMADGQTAFYPWGRWGKGIVVPPDTEVSLRRWLRRCAIMTWAFVLLLQPILYQISFVFGLVVAGAVILGAGVVQIVVVRRLKHRFEPARERLGIRDIMRTLAASLGWKTYTAKILICIFALAMTWMIFQVSSPVWARVFFLSVLCINVVQTAMLMTYTIRGRRQRDRGGSSAPA